MHNSISFIFWCLTLPTTNFKLNRKTAKNNQKTEYCTGDLFESDPACNYIPKVLQEDPKALEEMRKEAAALKKQ